MDIKYKLLKENFYISKTVCPPDEYYLRQKNLLHSLVEYIIERDMPKDERSERERFEECLLSASKFLDESK